MAKILIAICRDKPLLPGGKPATRPDARLLPTEAQQLMHELYDEAVVGEAYRARIEAIRAGVLAGADVAAAG